VISFGVQESKDGQPLPRLLACLVESAKAAGESRYATALALFGHQAVAFIPSRDILSLPETLNIDEAMHKRLKDIAAQHLGLADLERRFQSILESHTLPAGGNRVIAALNDMLVVQNTAHIFWGLCLGLALAEHAARGTR
jgi:hypothetical protein